MIFKETKLKDAFILELEKIEDSRGFFARSWCQKEFEERGLNSTLVQSNISFNKQEGTLRGMHFQSAPHSEVKLVRCTMGRIYDVIIDLRQKSQTFKKWISVKLTANNRKMLYIPEGFAHGFLTLTDDVEIFYQMSSFYSPKYARGVRWNDPIFSIEWPKAINIISEQDRNYPDYIEYNKPK
jgi:dTDP-4-dehydrorhamnose 3,5-epimerase